MSIFIKILDRLKIEYIEKGKRLSLCCPLHDDINPSASIYFDGDAFICFTCDIYYNPVQFIAHYYNLSYEDAKKVLWDEYGVAEKKFKIKNKKLNIKRLTGEIYLNLLKHKISSTEHFSLGENLDKICYEHRQGIIDENVFYLKFEEWIQKIERYDIGIR